jgi:hypothetical protein
MHDMACCCNPQEPIVFHPQYDIRFFGLENLHSFDAKKWGKVKQNLVSRR